MNEQPIEKKTGLEWPIFSRICFMILKESPKKEFESRNC